MTPDFPIILTDQPLDPAAITERVRSTQAGAVCVFLGAVREFTQNKQTTFLAYEAYLPMAQALLEELAARAAQRWPIVRGAIAHRLGTLDLGDISVIVAVSTPHRVDAFQACQWLMDTLKAEVPIWKRETWSDGAQSWVHPVTEPHPAHGPPAVDPPDPAP